MEKYKRTILDKFFRRPNFAEVEDIIKSMTNEDIDYSRLADDSHAEMLEGAEFLILSSEVVTEKIENILLNPQEWKSLEC